MMFFLSRALAGFYPENGTMTLLCFCEREGMYARGAQVTELPCCIRSAFNASPGTRGRQRMGQDGMASQPLFHSETQNGG